MRKLVLISMIQAHPMISAYQHVLQVGHVLMGICIPVRLQSRTEPYTRKTRSDVFKSVSAQRVISASNSQLIKALSAGMEHALEILSGGRCHQHASMLVSQLS